MQAITSTSVAAHFRVQLAQTPVIVDLALSDALRKAIAGANTLVVVGLANCRVTSKDHGLDFVHAGVQGLYFRTLDIFRTCRRHHNANAQQNDGKHQ